MRSIRTQLVLSLSAGAVVLATSAGIGLYAYMEEALERGLDGALAARAEAIAGAVHVEDDGQPHLATSALTSGGGGHHEGPFAFQIWRADGRTLARFAPNGPPEVPLPRPDGPRRRRFSDARLPDGTAGRVTELTFTALPDEDEFDAPHPPTARPAEVLTLVVAHDRRSIDGPLAVLLSGLACAAVAVVVGIVAVVTWTVRRGLRPLADMSRLADRIGPEALDVRFAAGTAVPAELRPIGAKLNDLLDRLAAAFERERQFSAAVAHELRTPLAELRSLCEVAARWPDGPDGAARSLAEALAIGTEMGTIVEHLLVLARCQAGVDAPRPEPTDLAVAVADAWLPAAPRAAERRLSVTVAIDPACRVAVDPRALSAVLRNLLANAAEHAAHAGRVDVRADVDPTGAVALRIGNDAPDLSPGDLAHLTDPFWRKDPARTGGGGHAGLGLAIVDAHCRAADIGLATRLGDDGWFEVTLRLAAVADRPVELPGN
jgi:signal transduction histidine kinase